MTDEAAFAMNGTVNTQNTRHWSEHRPDGNLLETSLRRKKVSVWAGICGNGAVIGPFFYDGALKGDTYNNMLQENIITSIRRAYGVRFRNCWFVQDGAPAHKRLTVRDTLRAAFGNRVIGLEFGIEWPPRSPDLTPCDFFLWGHVKNQVFKNQDSSPLSRDTPRENNSTIQFIEEQPSSNAKGRPLHENSCGKMPCS